VLLAVLGLGGVARAQSFCDVDGDGKITDTDGVNVLRAAAALSSGCTLALCDVDSDGQITDTDGVNVLRAAGALASACDDPVPPDGPEVTEFVTGVQSAGGTPAALRIGVAPIPGPNAPTTITDLDGSNEVSPGGTGNAAFGIGASGTAQISGGPGTAVLIRVRTQAGVVATNFYELPVASNGVDLDFDVADLAEGTGFFVDFATRDASDVVSVYASLEVVVICIEVLETCVDGPNDGEVCTSEPCETACNPRSCAEPECPGGTCQILFEPVAVP
jgi:hypothetical protein